MQVQLLSSALLTAIQETGVHSLFRHFSASMAVLGQIHSGWNRLSDRQFVGLRDRRFAIQFPPDGRIIPSKQAGELRLPARAALVVERDGDSNYAKLFMCSQSYIWVVGLSDTYQVRKIADSGMRDVFL